MNNERYRPGRLIFIESQHISAGRSRRRGHLNCRWVPVNTPPKLCLYIFCVSRPPTNHWNKPDVFDRSELHWAETDRETHPFEGANKNNTRVIYRNMAAGVEGSLPRPNTQVTRFMMMGWATEGRDVARSGARRRVVVANGSWLSQRETSGRSSSVVARAEIFGNNRLVKNREAGVLAMGRYRGRRRPSRGLLGAIGAAAMVVILFPGVMWMWMLVLGLLWKGALILFRAEHWLHLVDSSSSLFCFLVLSFIR